jgi:hypothetical protein
MIQALPTRASIVQQHLDALHTSSEVTRWFRKVREPHMEHVTPEAVIAALNRARIRFVLVGTHGLVGYRSQARATDDVDVLVTKRDVRKAARILEEAFPYLELVDTPVVTRFRNPVTQKILLDLMKPTSEVMRVVFRHTVSVGKSHRIPSLEMALVLKFVAMHAPMRRQSKRQIDLGDFIDLVEHNRNALDLDKLRRLANRVRARAGVEIVELVADIDAGRTVHL